MGDAPVIQLRTRPSARRRGRPWGCVSLVLLCGALTWLGFRLGDKDLLSRSEPALNLADLPADNFNPEYRWITDTRLLVVPYQGELNRAFLLDTVRHERTSLSTIQKHLARDPLGEAAWELSPDGSWLAWSVQGTPFVRAAHLDGTGLRTVRKPKQEEMVSAIVWQDQIRWIALLRKAPFGLPTRALAAKVSGRPTAAIRSLVELNDPRKPYWRMGASGSEEVQIPIAADTARHGLDYRTLSAPAGTQITAVAMDNKRQRVVVLTTTSHSRPFSGWIGRFWPEYALPQTYAGLWTCPTGRDKWREIGSIPIGRTTLGQPSELRWLPSDKRASFLFRGTIWTVPVN